jgi:hypothetical protein
MYGTHNLDYFMCRSLMYQNRHNIHISHSNLIVKLLIDKELFYITHKIHLTKHVELLNKDQDRLRV